MMIAYDWAAGITHFHAELYDIRSHGEECDVCGAKPGYWCFEWKILPGRLSSCQVPVTSHVIARAAVPSNIGDEIPVEHQALSSGRLRSGC